MRIYPFVSCLGIVLFLIGFHSSYAQVTDQTIGGIIVPKFTSTQNAYCPNGVCVTSPIPTNPNYIHSTSKYPVLLIKLSNTCEILDKHNMTGCHTVKSLIPYDTSNKLISGNFVNNNGIYTREPPQMKNNWLAYQYSNHKIICVECYFDFTATAKSQQIIINPNSFSYVNKTESEPKNMVYNYYGRFMQGCETATIANISGLLNDTINFMLNGCNFKSTNFNDKQIQQRPLHLVNYYSPFSTLNNDSYLKTIFGGHTYDFGNKTSGGRGPIDCITHKCNFIDPYKKIGY